MTEFTEEREPADRIEVLKDGSLQIRERTSILRNGIEIAKDYRRYVLHPGDDLSVCAGRIVAVAKSVWTDDVIAAWESRRSVIALVN